MTKIKVTHVGSLPRTQEVVDFIFARENNKPFDKQKSSTGHILHFGFLTLHTEFAKSIKD